MRLKTEHGYLIYWAESGGEWYVAGFMDPLLGVQSLEEATEDHMVDGFVWIADEHLRNVRAVRASDIREVAIEHSSTPLEFRPQMVDT